MPIFTDIANQWQIADSAFGVLEQQACAVNDDAAFDAAGVRRRRNDQAYFLYLFTRFEDAVNQAVLVILANRVTGVPWADRRIWESWSRGDIADVHFLAKVEILTDNSRNDYATIKSYYDGRNEVAHGGVWTDHFFIPAIAQRMEAICNVFPAN